MNFLKTTLAVFVVLLILSHGLVRSDFEIHPWITAIIGGWYYDGMLAAKGLIETAYVLHYPALLATEFIASAVVGAAWEVESLDSVGQ
jgi:hypothetical protein